MRPGTYLAVRPNPYRDTKFWEGRSNVWPVHGQRECDCHFCRARRRDRRQKRKASRARTGRAIAEQVAEYDPDWDALDARLLELNWRLTQDRNASKLHACPTSQS